MPLCAISLAFLVLLAFFAPCKQLLKAVVGAMRLPLLHRIPVRTRRVSKHRKAAHKAGGQSERQYHCMAS